HLRTVADATALQAAQNNHDTFADVSTSAPVAAAQMADDNWSGASLTTYAFDAAGTGSPLQGPNKPWLKINVSVEHPVGFLFQNMLASFGTDTSPLNYQATAQATIGIPRILSQVAPIATRCPSSPAQSAS